MTLYTYIGVISSRNYKLREVFVRELCDAFIVNICITHYIANYTSFYHMGRNQILWDIACFVDIYIFWLTMIQFINDTQTYKQTYKTIFKVLIW